MEELHSIKFEDVKTVGGDLYSTDEIGIMELKILKALKWDLHLPTAGEIAQAMLLASDLLEIVDYEKIFKSVENNVEFCLRGK